MRLRYRRNRAYRIKRQKAYYAAHREERKEYARRYYWKDPEASRASRRAYRLENIERILKFDRARARIRNASPESKAARAAYYQLIKPLRRRQWTEQVAAARKLLGNRCAACSYTDYPEILELDHVDSLHPKSIGRSRHWTDRAPAALRHPHRFQLLCPNCHAIKTVLEKIAAGKNGVTALKRRRARAQLVRRFGGRCAKCGYDKNELALEFDHKKPIFGKNRSSAIHHARKWPHLFRLLCANCHTIKTLKDLRARKASRAHA